jgi:hypothetical protein
VNDRAAARDRDRDREELPRPLLRDIDAGATIS